MASVTLTTDATNTAKLQAVVDYYNSQKGTSLTIKQWIIEMLILDYTTWNNERIEATIRNQLGAGVTVT
jgi:hypothetical protein